MIARDNFLQSIEKQYDFFMRHFKKKWDRWRLDGMASKRHSITNPHAAVPKQTVGIAFEQSENESKKNPFIAANLMPLTYWIIEQMAALYQDSKRSVESGFVGTGACKLFLTRKSNGVKD